MPSYSYNAKKTSSITMLPLLLNLVQTVLELRTYPPARTSDVFGQLMYPPALFTGRYLAVCLQMWPVRHCILGTGVHVDDCRIDSVALKRVTSATLEKLTGGRDGDYWRQRLIRCWRGVLVQSRLSGLLNVVCLKFLDSYFFYLFTFCSCVRGFLPPLRLSQSLSLSVFLCPSPSVRPNQVRFLCHSLDAICSPSSLLGHSDQHPMSVHTKWSLYNSNLQSKTLLSFQGPEDCERQTFKLEICLSGVKWQCFNHQ
jgi:hypothetical protein